MLLMFSGQRGQGHCLTFYSDRPAPATAKKTSAEPRFRNPRLIEYCLDMETCGNAAGTVLGSVNRKTQECGFWSPRELGSLFLAPSLLIMQSWANCLTFLVQNRVNSTSLSYCEGHLRYICKVAGTYPAINRRIKTKGEIVSVQKSRRTCGFTVM